MALLHIAEPGQSPLPHQIKRAVGIDLGTTNSLIATVRGGRPQALADEQGQVMLPSVVNYSSPGQIVVGSEAREMAGAAPEDTIASVKRFLARGQDEVLEQANDRQYKLAPNDGGMVSFATASGPISPVQASAEILSSLKRRAQFALGGDIEGAVITVPAYFDDAQRQATKDAAALAGLPVKRLLNEPTAAAVAYGLDSAEEGLIAVFDLGGGTFDISILQLHRGVFEVLATGGDTALGGDDFDLAITRWIGEQCPGLAGGHSRALLALSRSAKEALTEAEAVNIPLAELDAGASPLRLTREQFESLVQPLVKQALRSCRRALRDAGKDADEIENIVMVGGSTRVPLVRLGVAEFFGRDPLVSIDPDQVVALGAALQADILVGNRPEGDLLLLDVLPLSLGIETMGGLVEKVIPRNTTIPVTRAQEFTTYKDGQTALAVHVVQGERELVTDARSLARFELRGIPPMVAGAARIKVVYQVDADGLLNVSATEETTGSHSSITVKPSFGLGDDEIAQMLKASYSHAQEDKTARQLAEERVGGQQLLDSLEAALRADGEALLDGEERAALRAEMASVSSQLAGEEIAALRSAVERLGRHSEAFAARRMDQSIRQALAGVALDQLEDKVSK